MEKILIGLLFPIQKYFDVLFLIENNAKKVYRIYHLTYSKCNAKGFQRYIEFEDINSIREYLEKEFISDFIEI